MHPLTLGIDALACYSKGQERCPEGTMIGSPLAGDRSVVRRQHQRTTLHLSFKGQRHMNRHLIAVEVSIECGTNQRVQLIAFPSMRVGSNAWIPNRWRRRTIEHDGMLTNHAFQNVPDNRFLRFNHFLGLLDGCREAHQFQLIENEGQTVRAPSVLASRTDGVSAGGRQR